MGDPLKQLLLQSGWSYEDVLKRLEQYKSENVIKSSKEEENLNVDASKDENKSLTPDKSTIGYDSVINNNVIPNNENPLNEEDGVICVDVEILSDGFLYAQDQKVPHMKERDGTLSDCVQNEIATKPGNSAQSGNKKGIKILNHFKIEKLKNQKYTIKDLTTNGDDGLVLTNVNLIKENCDINIRSNVGTIGNCDSTMNDNSDNGLKFVRTENKDCRLQTISPNGRKHDLPNKYDHHAPSKRSKSSYPLESENKYEVDDVKNNEDVDLLNSLNSYSESGSAPKYPHSFFDMPFSKENAPEKAGRSTNSGDLIEELNNLFDDVESNTKQKFSPFDHDDEILLDTKKLLFEMGDPVMTSDIKKKSNNAEILDNEPSCRISVVSNIGKQVDANVGKKLDTSQEYCEHSKPQETSYSITNKLQNKRYNRDRLNHITNILFQKLQNDGFSETVNPTESVNEEVGIKILEVVGGYQSPEHEHEDQLKTSILPKINKNEETFPPATHKPREQNIPNSIIKPTKTNDVTKIKGWKKKKFATETLPEKTKQVNVFGYRNVEVPTSPQFLREDSVESSSNSAFTSDVLDQFLSENSRLNISYELPKLEAEQTLNRTYIDIKFPTSQQVQTSTVKPKKSGAKPKTLAEKRRMEELKLNPMANFLENMNRIQKKLCARETLKMKRKLVMQDVPFTRRCFVSAVTLTDTESVVLYGGKRLWVPSTKDNKVIEYINEVTPKRHPLPNIRQKPSLLRTSLNFSYDPKEWDDVRMKLPKIFVEVTPQLRKRIHPTVERYIKFKSADLEEERINFALSVLKEKGKPFVPQTFVFPVPYKKTKLMKKRIVSKPCDMPTLMCHEPENVIESSVTEVIGKLLDYCERLDETKDIIRNDDYQCDIPIVEETQLSVHVDKVTSTKSERSTLRKTEMEMRRLNCKLLSLPAGDNFGSKEPCKKQHCVLGCICSNFSTLLQQPHCGEYKCMFECTCGNRSKSKTFPQCVINQLQDEAKKNLAKEEKEFTQTLIKTNNELILVGDSDRRKRRSKAPKRYNDFIETEVLDHCRGDPTLNDAIDVPKPKEEPYLFYGNTVIPPCRVKLTKYNFKDIIPFCMIHSLYKCYCRQESSQNRPADKKTSPIKAQTPPKTLLKSTESKEKTPNSLLTPTELQDTIPIKRKLSSSDLFGKQTNTAASGQFGSLISKRMKMPSSSKSVERMSRNYCSRTMGVSSNILVRNKTTVHLRKIQKTTKDFDKKLHAYMVENADLILEQSDSSPSSPGTTDVVDNNYTIAHENDVPIENENLNDIDDELVIVHPPEELPVIEVLAPQENVPQKELKLQRRRKKLKPKKKKENEPRSVEQMKSEYLSFLETFTSKTRLLPWTQLMSKYASGLYQLWYPMCSKKNELVTLTESTKRPSPLCCNVRQIESSGKDPLLLKKWCNIVRYIVNKELPINKSKDQILALMLEIKEGVWKICGLCDKISNQETGQVSASIIEFYEGVQTITNMYNRENSVGARDLGIKNKKLSIWKKIFTLKSLIPNSLHVITKDKVLQARLPEIHFSCKWLVVPFNNNFLTVRFERCTFVIDLDDIRNGALVAHNYSATIAIKSYLLKDTYTHPKFGIYFDHLIPNKLFIGPYFEEEKHDLQFLNSFNKPSVELSEFFDGSQSLDNTCYWYRRYQYENDVDDDVEFIPTSEPLIDLTFDSEDEDTSQNLSLHEKQNQINVTTKIEEEKNSTSLHAQVDLIKSKDGEENEINVSRKIEEKDSTSLHAYVPIKSVIEKDSTSLSTQQDTSPKNGAVKSAENNSVNSLAKTGGSSSQGKRYLITNIPQVGYIPAHLHEDESLDIIVCSYSKIPRTFSHWMVAVELMHKVMMEKIFFVPSTFTLTVTMAEDVDHSKYNMLNKAIFNGYHIAGEFGVRYLGTVAMDELKELCLSKVEKDRLFLLLEKKLMQIMGIHLTRQLNLQISKVIGPDLLKFVSDKALTEIQRLQKESTQCSNDRRNLLKKKQELIARYKSIFLSLPPAIHKDAKKKLESILNVPFQMPVTHVRIADGEIINVDEESDSSMPDTENNSQNSKVLILRNSAETPSKSIEPRYVVKDISRANVINTTMIPIKPFVNLTLKKNLQKSVLQTVSHLAKVSLPMSSMNRLSLQNNSTRTTAAPINAPTVLNTTNVTSSVLPISSYRLIPPENISSMATLTTVPKIISVQSEPNYISLTNGNKINLLKLDPKLSIISCTQKKDESS